MQTRNTQHRILQRRTTSIRRLPILALAAALGLGLANSASAQTATPMAVLPGDGTLLSVSAQAEATRVPDIARVSAGVVTQAAAADAAKQSNATHNEKVFAAIPPPHTNTV